MRKFSVLRIGALAGLTALMLGATALTDPTFAQFRGPDDPGPRGGAPGAGGALPNLSATEAALFPIAKDVFNEAEDPAAGLGPRFNLDSCGGCHAQPDVGGTSPAQNPQAAVPQTFRNNTLPSFITPNGPVREARFVKNPDGSTDGGVHALFVTTGAPGAPATCTIKQPDFATQLRNNNVIFRIPTPTFGLGLVEVVTDRALEASLAASGQLKAGLGISGRFNRSGNDGSITRFGWKAQNKSLMIFSGEAYNVEMGITNEMFPNERTTDGIDGCDPSPDPDSGLPTESSALGNPMADFASDAMLFTAFMRLSAPPAPATSQVAGAGGAGTATAASIARGQQVFSNIGCQACHNISLTTGKTSLTGQSNVTIRPYSDFAIHDMGVGLADNVSQGGANGREFRTAPLWGVGQRIFFLHDGRTKDIIQAIQQHSSTGSEANGVISNYRQLSNSDQQNLVNFLRSL